MSKQKKEPTIPTVEEIAKLPRWAIVAFAARCARRVQPLFVLGWPEAPDKHKEAVNKAIKLAEKYASHITTRAAARAVDAAGRAAFAARRAALAARRAALAADAADAPALVAMAARAAVDAADAANAASAAADAADAVDAAGRAADAANVTTFITNIWMDYNKLKQTAESENWTDDTQVQPKFFELLRPDWKKILAKQKKKNVNQCSEEMLRISLYLRKKVEPKKVIEKVVELRKALNRYHIAGGGNGLIIDDWQNLILSDVPEEVLK
jgi:hypothetical protein